MVPPSKKKASGPLVDELEKLRKLFTVPTAQLKTVTKAFEEELAQGLAADGAIPMRPSWVLGRPSSKVYGQYYAIDLTSENLRLCSVFFDEDGQPDIQQSNFHIARDSKSASERWAYVADSLAQFIERLEHVPNKQHDPIHLSVAFNDPVESDYIDHGVLQRWTRGYDVEGWKGQDVVPIMQKAFADKGLPVKLVCVINDTVGTLLASAYTMSDIEMGVVFGRGSSAAYFEEVGEIKKTADVGKVDPKSVTAVGCEWAEFDNAKKVLPWTKYEKDLDTRSRWRGERAFDKLIAGFYIHEIFRLILVDVADNSGHDFFKGKDISKLREKNALDPSFLYTIETDPFENLFETQESFEKQFGIVANHNELKFMQGLTQILHIRAGRLAACGIAAICLRKNIKSCKIAADGSVFNHCPAFRVQLSAALGEILDWPTNPGATKPIEFVRAEDGNGVGAALVAAMTVARIKQGEPVRMKTAVKID